MTWFPTTNPFLVHLATPDPSSTAPGQRTFGPLVKSTVPVAGGRGNAGRTPCKPDGASGVTVAVNVTDWPKTDGFTLLVSSTVTSPMQAAGRMELQPFGRIAPTSGAVEAAET